MGCDNMRAMKVLFRSLLLWLLLLALPFQGVASASMLLCAPLGAAAQPASQARAMPAGHDHAAMHAGADHDGVDGHAQGGAKCGTPGACCVGASLLADISVAVPCMPSGSQPVPFHARALPAVDLAGFERPPKFSLA